MFKKTKLKTMLMLLAVIFFASSCTKHEMASEMQTQNGSSPLSYTTSELPIGGAKEIA